MDPNPVTANLPASSVVVSRTTPPIAPEARPPDGDHAGDRLALIARQRAAHRAGCEHRIQLVGPRTAI
jgi:hypothetical protein